MTTNFSTSYFEINWRPSYIFTHILCKWEIWSRVNLATVVAHTQSPAHLSRNGSTVSGVRIVAHSTMSKAGVLFEFLDLCMHVQKTDTHILMMLVTILWKNLFSNANFFVRLYAVTSLWWPEADLTRERVCQFRSRRKKGKRFILCAQLDKATLCSLTLDNNLPNDCSFMQLLRDALVSWEMACFFTLRKKVHDPHHHQLKTSRSRLWTSVYSRNAFVLLAIPICIVFFFCQCFRYFHNAPDSLLTWNCRFQSIHFAFGIRICSATYDRSKFLRCVHYCPT